MQAKKWQLKTFEALTNTELYKILQLRATVFVIEQKCVFQDLDDRDKQGCHHLFLEENEKIVAYARLLSPNTVYPEASIGRVVTHPDYRRQNLGKDLLKKSLEILQDLYPYQSIKIGAQLYLKQFYAGFGFRSMGGIYLEDGIEHTIMLFETPNPR